MNGLSLELNPVTFIDEGLGDKLRHRTTNNPKVEAPTFQMIDILDGFHRRQSAVSSFNEIVFFETMGIVFNDDTAVGDDNSDNDDNYDNNLQSSIKDHTDHNSNYNNNVGYEANCTTDDDNDSNTDDDNNTNSGKKDTKWNLRDTLNYLSIFG